MNDERRARLLASIDVARWRGLEIGALNRPVVRRSDGDIVYVDVKGADELRPTVPPGTNADDLVDVDYIWGASPLREMLPNRVDYVVASHVIEHVPDLLGWLLELHAVTKPGGLISLAVPDRRFTFDYNRPESTLGDIVEAYLTRRSVPSLRHVFDNCNLGVLLDHQRAWREEIDGASLPRLTGVGGLQLAFDQCRRLTEDDIYIDSHCWIFTPSSFLDVASSLAQLELFPFSISRFEPTNPDDIEFLVQLQTVGSSGDPGIGASIRAAHEQLTIAGDPGDKAPDVPAPPLRPRAFPALIAGLARAFARPRL